MGIKAHLACELETMLASGGRDGQLADWMRQNSAVVIRSLAAMDDMVEIQEIDLKDMPAWARARGLLTPVAVGAKHPS